MVADVGVTVYCTNPDFPGTGASAFVKEVFSKYLYFYTVNTSDTFTQEQIENYPAGPNSRGYIEFFTLARSADSELNESDLAPDAPTGRAASTLHFGHSGRILPTAVGAARVD